MRLEMCEVIVAPSKFVVVVHTVDRVPHIEREQDRPVVQLALDHPLVVVSVHSVLHTLPKPTSHNAIGQVSVLVEVMRHAVSIGSSGTGIGAAPVTSDIELRRVGIHTAKVKQRVMTRQHGPRGCEHERVLHQQPPLRQA
jgi:hypothetical protein